MSLPFIDEYRDADLASRYIEKIKKITTKPWKIMEACGGQTHAIIKYGLDQMLPKEVELIHGPGCPVCVTPMSTIDAAINLASRKEIIFATFGDMLRVPGTDKDLLRVRAEGGDIRIVYSPLDAVTLANHNPQREVVFFAVGFETTAPANAMAVYQAKKNGLSNFSMLMSQVLVPPALSAILSSPQNLVQGFLAPGHVCTVMGIQEYEPIVQKFKVPIVVTGFEPGDLLQGLCMCIDQLENGRAELENQYTRSVNREGNLAAQKMLIEVFQIGPKVWRGLGSLPESGYLLRDEYRELDATIKFNLGAEKAEVKSACMSGLILQGQKKPMDCPEFGKGCNPERPLGATMVSAEGACSAYYQYRHRGDIHV